MPRATNNVAARARHRKLLKQAEGYYGAKSRLYRIAKEAVERGLNYAYRDRRNRKRDFRKLWIMRINAACREQGMSYSQFIAGLKAAEVEVDRKVLADLAVRDKETFGALVATARGALEAA